jgi:nucleoid-associated protein YgaU/DNA-binding SARP family transcriptional activator
VVVEIASRLRGIPAPHLPALSAPQGLVRTLVSTAAALFLLAQPARAAILEEVHRPGVVAVAQTEMPATTTADRSALSSATTNANVTGGRAGVAGVAGGAAMTAVAGPPPVTGGRSGTPPVGSGASRVPASTVDHVVRPGETLWTIAERYLGDGTRFQEIAVLNYGRRQADGEALTDSHWITPGWHLAVPTDPAETPGPRGVHEITVQPGQTLWEIAESVTGDGADWPEIYEASRDRIQPDGARLTDPDRLRAGWTLAVPQTPTPKASTPTEPTPAESAPVESATAEPSPVEPSPVEPSPVEPSPVESAPVESAPAESAPVTASAPPAETVDDLDDAAPWAVRTTGGVGALLAAGVVTTLGARRRTQTLRRRPGQSAPPPLTPRLTTTEQRLRAVADPLATHTIDLVLRTLARHCAGVGLALPTVRALRFDRSRVELYLATPAALPAPWTTPAQSIEATLWRLEPDEAPILDEEELAAIPAPYPSLVTLGHDAHDAHVMVDLEYLGHLAITGPVERTRAVVAAMVLELATSTWSDDVQLTVVGDYAAVEDVIATGRIRYQPTLGRAIEDLIARSVADRAALTDAGAADLGSARVTGVAPQTWTPEILLVTTALTATQREVLREAVVARPHTAHAVVTVGSDPGNWTLEVPDGTGPALLAPIGMVIHPQELDDETRGDIVQLIAGADPQQAETPDGTAPAPPSLREPAPTALLAVTPAGPEPAAPQPDPPTTDPVIGLLGPVIVTGARGSVEPSKKSRLTELLAYLALHPGTGHRQIDEALWPGRRHEDNLNTRNTATSKARSWLGRSETGEEYLPRHSAGNGYRLAPSVGTDWRHWLDLVGDGALTAATEDLERALALVRGRPFDGVHPKRYAWADTLRQRMTHQIVDVSYEVARRRLTDGHWQSAERALAVGLMVEPAWEPLWRLRIMAAYEARNPVAVDEAIARLLAITDALGGDLEPTTLELLDAVRRR